MHAMPCAEHRRPNLWPRCQSQKVRGRSWTVEAAALRAAPSNDTGRSWGAAYN